MLGEVLDATWVNPEVGVSSQMDAVDSSASHNCALCSETSAQRLPGGNKLQRNRAGKRGILFAPG